MILNGREISGRIFLFCFAAGKKNYYDFYAILCVKFVREVRYFTSKGAIISLSALVVRKVTGSEIIGCSVRKAMRKVPGAVRRAARIDLYGCVPALTLVN